MYFLQNNEMLKNQIVKSDDDGIIYIPNDLANTDYRAYLAWVAEGNTPLEWSPE
jgi:hypothetical protein